MRNFNRFNYKCFYPLFALSYKPKIRTRFSASWWSARNISIFLHNFSAHYFKAMSNSIGFYKGIFLHVISVRTSSMLQSAGTFPSRMIAFIKSAMILQQISGAAFNISETTPEGPAAFPFFVCHKSSGVMNCVGQATVHNAISMLASLMHHQVKDYNNPIVYISLQLHPDFQYAFV